MEEADTLADRIAVVVDGTLKCIGTPLNLKNTFGKGYKITVVSDVENHDRIIKLMNKIAPSNSLIDQSGGQLFFAVPLVMTHEIAPLFKLIEGPSEEPEFDPF